MSRHRFIVSLGFLVGCATQHLASSAPSAPAGTTRADGAAGVVLVNRDHHGIALDGYDPVAYFTDGKPVMGDPNIRAIHEGATYYFASEDHRWQFLRDPTHFAPAFGGYCGFAASIKRLSPTSPQFWQIVDGHLVLQHNQHAYDLFNQGTQANFSRASANWPELQKRNALPSHYVVNVDPTGVALAGFDPLSYRDGKPERGAPEHSAHYGGATYWFTSEAHRGAFESSPARFAPAFGGFCGYAASIGVFAPVDPMIYVVQDDRLILQHTAQALSLYNKDPVASLKRADANWPGLVLRAGL